MTDNGFDLFSFRGASESETSQYPDYPGSRGGETSAAAAADLAPRLGNLQRIVLGAIEAAGERGMTADEVAASVDLDRWSVQPRTSELRAKGKIRDSGQRRPNASGKKAIAWIAASIPEAAPPARAA